MSIQISLVESKKDLKTFVSLHRRILKGHPALVPPLISIEMQTLDPARNPAYEGAETRLFLARRDGRPVGGVAGILSHAANEKHGTKNLRFGWFESIDDYEVAEALFRSLEDMARTKGLTSITGPQGFTDLDFEGLLVSGFDYPTPVTGRYNPPYYRDFVERYGFVKEIDYVEHRILPFSDEVFSKITALAARTAAKGRFRMLHLKNSREAAKWGRALFDLHNEAYSGLYGTVPLSDRQIDFYLKHYLSVIDLEITQLVVDENDELAGFFVALPSLSQAFRKAGGRLLPWGWLHIMSALRKREALDFYIVGVRGKYHGIGVPAMLVGGLIEAIRDMGFKYAETSHLLESNTNVQSLFKVFDHFEVRRRRIYRKELD